MAAKVGNVRSTSEGRGQISKASYQIRHATREDRNGIKALIRSAGVHPIFLPDIKWHNYVVAVSDAGAVIGCSQVKVLKGGIRELASVAVDEAWRKEGVATAIIEFVVAHFPHPLWCICWSALVPFYQSVGAVEVVDSRRIPLTLRLRRCIINAVMRLVRSERYLSVCSIDT